MIGGQTILGFASGYDAPPTSKHHVMHVPAARKRTAPGKSSSDRSIHFWN